MDDMLFAILQVTNDTEHNANFLNLQNWQHRRPCNWCPASGERDSIMPYSDFSEDSAWIPLQVKVDDWIQEPIAHPLWEAWCLIGITLFSLCLDILHILDLGVLQYFLGSAIWTLVHESSLGGTFHERGEHVWRLLREAQVALGTNYRERLQKEDFWAVFGRQVGPSPGKFPELSGKAARTRHALPAVLKVAERMHAEQHLNKEEHVLRLRALRSITEFYAIVMAGGLSFVMKKSGDRCLQRRFLKGLPGKAFNEKGAWQGNSMSHTSNAGGHVLSEEEADDVVTAVDAFLRTQNELAMIYWDRGVRHYNVTFKSHLFWHMARQARFFNPRHGWTYRDESFVGSVAKVLHSVISGNGALRSGRALAVKWRRLQWFRYRRRQGAIYLG